MTTYDAIAVLSLEKERINEQIEAVIDNAYAIIPKSGVHNSKRSLNDLKRLKEAIETAIHDLSWYDLQSFVSCDVSVPHERDWYLGIFKESKTGWVNPIPFVCDYVGSETPVTTKDFWIIKGVCDKMPALEYFRDLECVAWAYLPEPHIHIHSR